MLDGMYDKERPKKNRCNPNYVPSIINIGCLQKNFVDLLSDSEVKNANHLSS